MGVHAEAVIPGREAGVSRNSVSELRGLDLESHPCHLLVSWPKRVSLSFFKPQFSQVENEGDLPHS